MLRSAPLLEELIARDPLLHREITAMRRAANSRHSPTFTIETERGNLSITPTIPVRAFPRDFPSPVNDQCAESPDLTGCQPARERHAMQCFYPGDLVTWAGCPFPQYRGVPWQVLAYRDEIIGENRMPEQTYRIVPSNSTGREEHVVGRSKLVRRTTNDHAFEPGDHVIYDPARVRATAEDETMKRIIVRRWVGEVQSSYMSDHAPGDIIVKFAARELGELHDWNAIRWREDFRPATAEEVRNKRGPYETAMQAFDRGMHNARVREREQADRAHLLLTAGQGSYLTTEQLRAAMGLGVDLASGPDMTVAMTTLDKLIASAPPPKQLQPVAKPEPPRVIGGKRKLGL